MTLNNKKNKYGEVDFPLFATVLFLVAIGVIMVYSASSWVMGLKVGDDMYYLKKQLLFAIIGIVLMIVMSNIDYHKLKSYAGIILIVCIPMLLAVFAFQDVNGARRWIKLGPLSFQPSEIAKYAVVLFIAKTIDIKGENIKTFFRGIVPCLLVACFFSGLVLAEKNLSIATIIILVTIGMLFVAGAKKFQIFGLAIPASILAAIYFALGSEYRRKRIMTFLNPSLADPLKEGYQLRQSLLALGSGGIWGVGLGQSRQKCFYLPEPQNDFIFAIIGEELGLIGCVFIIILFLIFVWRGIHIATNSKDNFGTLLASGITAIIAIQSIINIAVVTGSMPVTGVPLPFISAGGTSLVINLIGMGVLLNISRQSKKIVKKS